MHSGHNRVRHKAQREKLLRYFQCGFRSLAPTILPDRSPPVGLLCLLMQTQLVVPSVNGDVHTTHGVSGCSACVSSSVQREN